MTEVNENEVVEPLDEKNIIIQPKSGYRFGGDAVALSKFSAKYIKGGMKVFDLCSGCGVVGILVELATGAEVIGAELDGELCGMSARSAAANGLKARFFNADIRDFSKDEHVHIFTRGAFDAVVCNPPFFKADSRARKIAPTANSELTAKFSDVARASAWLLKSGGALYVVHTSSRLDEVMRTLGDNGLTPKALTVNRNGKTFLLRAVKGGKPGLTVDTEVF
ncbi:MAG: methyltransferase [Clostridiales bacterium]|nr:methyltransferase [Clostridiales bacterium]